MWYFAEAVNCLELVDFVACHNYELSLFPSKPENIQRCSFAFPVTPECDPVHSLGTVGLSGVLKHNVKFHNS